MTRIKDAAARFLEARSIAVTGVSKKPETEAGNAVYRRFRERGYQVYAVNPHADSVEGDPAYPNLRAIPGGVDAVVIVTRPEQAKATVQEAIDLGITQVWFHRGMGPGSVDREAVELGRANGLTVIGGGCPLMFGATADGGHKFICAMLKMTGVVPRNV